MKREVWKVFIKSYEDVILESVYHVFATSAAVAERRAVKLAKKDKVPRPYCTSAEFECYVY